MKVPVTALLIDLDGTLVDSGKDLAITANLTRQYLGLPALDQATITSYVGDGLPVLIRRILSDSDPTEEKISKATEFFRNYYDRHSTDYTTPYPGVIETLEYFHSKIKVIITNKILSLSMTVLEKLNLTHFFDLVLGGDSFPKIKPDPMPIIEVLKRFSLSPEQVVMIGDSSNDIIAGQLANVLTCGVTYGLRPKEELEQNHPDFLIADFSKLQAIFD